MQPATEAGHSSNERRAMRAGGRVLLELYERGHRRSGSTRLPRAARAPPLGRPRPPHQPGLVSPRFLSLSLSQPVAQKEMFEMDVVRVRSHSRTNPVRAPERDTVRHSLPPCRLKPLRGSLPGWGVAPRYSYYGVTTGWMVGAPPIRDSLSLKVPPVPAWQHFICNSPFAGRPPPTQPYLSTVHVCRT